MKNYSLTLISFYCCTEKLTNFSTEYFFKLGAAFHLNKLKICWAFLFKLGTVSITGISGKGLTDQVVKQLRNLVKVQDIPVQSVSVSNQIIDFGKMCVILIRFV